MVQNQALYVLSHMQMNLSMYVLNLERVAKEARKLARGHRVGSASKERGIEHGWCKEGIGNDGARQTSRVEKGRARVKEVIWQE